MPRLLLPMMLFESHLSGFVFGSGDMNAQPVVGCGRMNYNASTTITSMIKDTNYNILLMDGHTESTIIRYQPAIERK